MIKYADPGAGLPLPIASTLLFVLLAVLLALTLTGCGSSKPKVAVEKTMILHGKMYNVSRYSTYAAVVEGQLPDGEVLPLTNVKKGQFNDYLKQGSPIQVTTKFVMDSEDVIYESKSVKSSGDFSSMTSSFSRAAKKFSKFMDDAGETQLILD